jgi:RNA polymerase sigma-70 factor (ECF subfamily)
MIDVDDPRTVDTESVYREFDAQLRRFIKGRVRDADAAEDILQDVYLRIHNGLGRLRSGDRLEAWIYSVARNAIIDHYRRPRIAGELPEELAEPEEEERDAMSSLSSSLRSLLACLPADYRQAIEMTEFEGLTQAEMGRRTGLSLSGAKSRVQRARVKLAQALLDCCHLEFDRLGRVMDYRRNCDQCATGCPSDDGGADDPHHDHGPRIDRLHGSCCCP